MIVKSFVYDAKYQILSNNCNSIKIVLNYLELLNINYQDSLEMELYNDSDAV